MKFDECALGLLGVGSHPSRGAWIEIRWIKPKCRIVSVAPLTGCVD